MNKKLTIVSLLVLTLIASSSVFAQQETKLIDDPAPLRERPEEPKEAPVPAGNPYLGKPHLDLEGPLSEGFESGYIPADWTVYNEDGDSYQWHYDEGSEFTGDYHADPFWKDRHTTRLLRAYDKVRFWRIGEAEAGLLFFLQHSSDTRTEVSRLLETEADSKEHTGQLSIETNPFLNCKFRRGYFDFGVLFELDLAGMENTRTRWNSVSHADQTDVLWSTTPYAG